MQIPRMQILTKELIAIDSTSGREGEICKFLEVELVRRRMQVQSFQVEKDRHNLLASWRGHSPRILFNTHLDTVPEQYGPHEDDDRIYGRGACDTHGILAAQLESLADLHEEGIEDTGILLVVGEEADHCGAIHAATCQDIQEPEVLIVGEPTENKLMKSQKGRLKADLIAYGIEGHSGYPEKFDSAVEKLFQALDCLWRQPWLKKHSQSGTTMNVTMLSGGETDNQIPAIASVRLLFRCAEPAAEIKENVITLLNDLDSGFKGCSPNFELKWDPAMNDPVLNLATLSGFETGAAAFNTDIAYFGWNNSRTFLVGPGSILQAHRNLKDGNWQAAEWISKQSQIQGVSLYKQLVRSILQ